MSTQPPSSTTYRPYSTADRRAPPAARGGDDALSFARLAGAPLSFDAACTRRLANLVDGENRAFLASGE
ncbi:hypothetical protein ACFQPA_13820 [Halomarina halobia]|uniref:Uncharacterized protein n=1 Tax=Halomarina halobia TaxID=3033386 RepID=A0ABD6A960_9EURY|nr:hypothetical protein [Halomarina sp. PSR21]